MEKQFKYEHGQTVYFYLNDPRKYKRGVVSRIEMPNKDTVFYQIDYKSNNTKEMTVSVMVREDYVFLKPPLFERQRANREEMYYIINREDQVATDYEYSVHSDKCHFKNFNYFIDKDEAQYIRDNMNSKLLRAIWQWKYWNDNGSGEYVIGKLDDTGKYVPFCGYNLPEYEPTFSTWDSALECIRYLKEEGLIN